MSEGTSKSETEWVARRDQLRKQMFTDRADELQSITADAEQLLVDRTVVRAQALPHEESCDCTNVLRLTLDTGDVVDITGGYDGYTGYSCDEYHELISVAQVPALSETVRSADA